MDDGSNLIDYYIRGYITPSVWFNPIRYLVQSVPFLKPSRQEDPDPFLLQAASEMEHAAMLLDKSPLGKGGLLSEAGGAADPCQFHSAISRKVEGRAL
jgi:hypothetical protein